MDQKIILPTDKESASFKKVSGWVSADGYFYGNDKDSERMARWAGSTHKVCDCGAIIEKQRYCEKCHDKKRNAQFAAMEKLPWDENTPVVIFDSDEYFNSWEEIDDYCDEHECIRSDLQLCHCVPSEPPYFDIYEFLSDILPEDFSNLQDDITAAADELNETLEMASPISWEQGKTAVSVIGNIYENRNFLGD
ncbi:MAG: hypothetical protein RBR14_08930 [Candidatus Cloacimonas acidaminovorans]|jgi:hypothetical protein|nr:hypothetical protein [Candidatus Cloacimonas acidaminovorans]